MNNSMEPTEELSLESETTARSTTSQTGLADPLSVSSRLRVLLIGEREAGKSAVGNAILGRGVFDSVGVRTKEAVRKQGTLAERQLTVVDTPGWEWFPSRGSSLAVRREIIHGVSLCQPGPHAVLLVVPLSFSFTKRERQVVVEHMELLGERVWGHTLVLFTVKGGQLRDSTLEEEVEENEELQGLVDRCGGRLHALYGQPRRGHNAVADLLAKLEDLVEANAGEVLPSDEILEEAKQKEVEDVRQHQERERQEEEELKRMREALRDLETDEEEGEASEESVRQPRVRRASSTIVESGSADATSPPRHLTWSDLRSTFSQNCKMQ